MPSRDRYEGEDYDRPRPKKSNTLLWVLAAIGCVIFVVVVSCGTVAALGWGKHKQAVEEEARQAEDQAKAAAAKAYTREEFKAKVMGKTEAEVIAAVGKPNDTSGAGGGVRWYYTRVTTDPATGKTDGRISVWFEGGRVVSVNF